MFKFFTKLSREALKSTAPYAAVLVPTPAFMLTCEWLKRREQQRIKAYEKQEADLGFEKQLVGYKEGTSLLPLSTGYTWSYKTKLPQYELVKQCQDESGQMQTQRKPYSP